MGEQGLTLIELIVAIIIVGILATVATRYLGESVETARAEQTKTEMAHLAYAIAGNPVVSSDGARSDFGYVGDVGALPPDLDALAANPGGYATWEGPYVEIGSAGNEHLTDAWGAAYVFAGTLLRSTGSGANIDKMIANTAADLTSNTVTGHVVDADRESPGPTYRDSIRLILAYPDGVGSMAAAAAFPSHDGTFTFTGIPMGHRDLTVVYLPDADTATYPLCVLPGRTTRLDIVFPADLW